MVESAPLAPAAESRGNAKPVSIPSSRPRDCGSSQTSSSAEPYRGRARRPRASTLSSTLSDARHSIRSSTDEFIRPRAASHDEETCWQSVPLILALVPALGGIFFRNGGEILTDITLLCLASMFLNWSVRVPWDWYRSAQTSVAKHPLIEEPSTRSNSEQKEADTIGDSRKVTVTNKDSTDSHLPPNEPHVVIKARRELRTHASMALASCFICPLLGTWLLHALRPRLSRPSEGLISDFNLTIFLLAAEIRPFTHLLKLVQARTLYLHQVADTTSVDQPNVDTNEFLSLSRRVSKLEADVVKLSPQTVIDQTVPYSSVSDKGHSQRNLHQLDIQVQTLNADIGAIIRAVRKYEKRITVLTLETDARFDDLESCIRILNSESNSVKPRRGSLLLCSIWALAKFAQNVLTLPWHVIRSMALFPIKLATWWFCLLTRVLNLGMHSMSAQRGK